MKYSVSHSQEPIQKIAEYMKDEQIKTGIFGEADEDSFRTKYIYEIKIIFEIS